MIQADSRTGVFVVREYESRRIVCVWGNVFRIEHKLWPEEYEVKRRCRIVRGEHSAPILITSRGTASSFLLGRTICQFERENQVVCKPVELWDLDSRATVQFDRTWVQLTPKQRLIVLKGLTEQGA
jgi:hypothetical protein